MVDCFNCIVVDESGGLGDEVPIIYFVLATLRWRKLVYVSPALQQADSGGLPWPVRVGMWPVKPFETNCHNGCTN